MHPLSSRSFLSCFAAIISLSLGFYASTVSAADPAINAGLNPSIGALPPEEAWKSLPAHPRLFADAARWGELRNQIVADPVSAQLFKIQKQSADFLLTQPPVVFVKEGMRMLESMRQSLYRIGTLASVARLTGDRRYVDRALVEMRALASLKSWNPSHFLDVAEASMALAIGYDWLYQDLSPEDRALCEGALLQNGLKTSFDPDQQSWITLHSKHNWNQVCNGGLVAAALAVAECDPALARSTVQRAIDMLPLIAAPSYAPDGVYPEGPGYWEYGTTYHVLLIEALRTVFGNTFGLDAFRGFMASADYMAQMNTPGGRLFNYADCTDGSVWRGSTPVLFWFARQRSQPGMLRRELDRLGPLIAGMNESLKNGRFVPDRSISPFELLWWQPPDANDKPAAALPLNWYGDGSVPLAVHRSAWDDPLAIFLGFKGGCPDISHGHMDIGSFVLESDGIRWALDTGPQDYNSLESQGINIWDYTQYGGRWKVFRLGPEAHNIIRFNGGRQLVDGRSTLVKFQPDGDHPHTIFDLTSLYRDQVASARRGVSLRADRSVVIQDEWTTGDKPAEVVWQWLTTAEVNCLPERLFLQRNGKSLRLHVLAPEKFTIEVEDVSKPSHPYDQPNPGLKRIVIRTSTPPNSEGRLAIVAEPGPWKSSKPTPVPPLAEW